MRNIVKNHMDPCSGADMNMLSVVSDMLERIFTNMVDEDLVTEEAMTRWLSAHEVHFARSDEEIGCIYGSLVELDFLPEDFDPVKALNVLQGMFVVLKTEDVPQREILMQQMNDKREELERATGKVVDIEACGVLKLIDPIDAEDK